MRRRAILLVAVMITAILSGSAAAAYAQAPVPKKGPITIQNHSWGGYHWARTANPFTLKVGDNVSSQWDGILNTTISDWSKSTVLDLTKVAGQAKGNCSPTSGRVEVCNKNYGNNGWLGLAQIWVSGKHITQGVTKLNDTYFNTATYNTTAWRNLVSCQEVGHTLGLDHQDENFNNANLGTCMDYTNNPGTNQHPNQHDYDELVTIYSHLDNTTTVGANTPSRGSSANPNDLRRHESGDGPSAWGREVFRSADGRHSVYELDFGKGEKKLTHVTWTEEQAAKNRGKQK
jgi:hypothetical protein